jgi:DNA-binding NarL/FixJ family response regulator
MTFKHSVLIAEDHALLRAGMCALLASEPNLEVVADVGTGEEAVRFACSLNPDVVLMDLNMPGRGGLHAIAEICRRAPATKILVITMHKTDEYIQEALRSGASGYILKESGHDELRTAIRTVLGGRTYLSPEVSARMVSNLISGGSHTASTTTAKESLTSREREVLKLVAEGFGNKQVANHLSRSIKTVEKHRANLMRKLNLRNVAMLTAYAIRNEIVAG